MGLTDTAVRASKPKERDYKLADGGGLYLLVTKAGGKLWRLKYRSHGVERTLALGKYPDVTLGAARKARNEAGDGLGRLVALTVTPGQRGDAPVAADLVSLLPASATLAADRGVACPRAGEAGPGGQ